METGGPASPSAPPPHPGPTTILRPKRASQTPQRGSHSGPDLWDRRSALSTPVQRLRDQRFRGWCPPPAPGPDAQSWRARRPWEDPRVGLGGVSKAITKAGGHRPATLAASRGRLLLRMAIPPQCRLFRGPLAPAPCPGRALPFWRSCCQCRPLRAWQQRTAGCRQLVPITQLIFSRCPPHFGGKAAAGLRPRGPQPGSGFSSAHQGSKPDSTWLCRGEEPRQASATFSHS